VQSGLVASDSLTNETKTQQELQANPGYWTYYGSAPAETPPAPYNFNRDAQGLHIGVQASSPGKWAGFFAESPNHNAYLWNSLTTNPVRTIPNQYYENGMYVQTANGKINYVTCSTLTNNQATVWTIVSTTGNTNQATTFKVLWMDNSSNQPLTRDCTIITNGNNYLKVYLDGVKVYENRNLKLQMPAPFNAFLEPETSYASMLTGTFQNYYVTTDENIKVNSLPSNAARVDVDDSSGKVLATSQISSGTATLNVGMYHFPLAAAINVYDSSNALIVSSSQSIYGGDVYSFSGSSGSTPTVPSPPTGLTATAISSSQINLSWTAPSNNGGSAITGYKIERSADGGSTWSILVANATPTATTYSDTGLTSNTPYTFRVSAINAIGTSSPSNTASTTTLPTPPATPTGVTATAISSNSITVSWNASPSATSYNIYRSTSSSGPFPMVGSTAATSSTDTGLSPGTTYYYEISAANSGGESAPSSPVSATTISATTPQPPTGLTANAVSSSQTNLSWTVPSNNGGSAITGYKIERSIDGGTTWLTIVSNTASTSTTYSDTGLASSTTYTYRVSAINSVGTSSPSNTASATTLTGTTSNNIVLNGIQTTSGTVSSSPYQITLSNFNVGTGSNHLLVVGVEANNNYATSITFGGVQLTKKVQSFYNNDAEFWYLTNPSGTGNIVVTMNGPTSVVVGAYSFSGVNQTNPIPTSVTNHNAVSSSPTISITTAYPNSLVLDSPSIWGGVTLGSPTCTQSWDVNIPGAITGASSSTIKTSAGSVTCRWTASSGDLWDDAAIEVKASG
jgi:fibronectin type 3 domain-containing protein